ncbi:penicillin-binding protein 2 [Plantibacter sp. VKM Ac-2885]|jgi:peptidoglycan glycosyltransferase|uniref:peptidoglycan D,D-transpeptidase FtsI family protein n=1 Tax=unclassified Plantibacter TaxID=2624265 RepID=UPI0008DCCF44|nr:MULTISPECIES: penicillin-binding transpeptidase domain-containing protein [unclassified Plantibacter]MBD8100983.1 penicillin-binding protein 2 [Plantibacter sp. CFBP 8775]MBD8517263.1 penicillin-binding protein 2 [Plantibacter sp. CFBP 8804]MBD8533500.1 penicillin-binding protein 2 [Plantibacter sp. CFBP 13570]MBF4511029.1 penicillin-binding protein 2 [Plantibacter sp. VKM Ac-2885]OII38742.1 cell division protein FtsI [Plantibacter sp. MMLR14_011]
MNRELKRVSIVVLAMFLALFGSTTIIQMFQADTLNADGRNTRTLYDSYRTERGPILLTDGTAIASSVASDDEYKYQRVYANGPLYAPVTGYFSPTQGSSGLELATNDLLSGTSNSQFLDSINRLISGQAPKGAAVEVTLDPVVQQAAFDALGDQEGAIVAIEPKTGKILASVSSPGYDPNVLASHDNAAVLDAYRTLDDDDRQPLLNKGVDGDLDPPGSTFKLVTAAAAFASGDYTPESEFPNPSTYTLPGTSTVIRNSEGGSCGGGATVSIATAVELSCNIPLAELGVELGYEKIRDMAQSFGFNMDVNITGTGLNPMPMQPSTFPNALSDDQTAMAAFGQYTVRASALQMAMVSAGIANGGIVCNPQLVNRVVNPDLSVLKEFEPAQLSQPISSSVAKEITDIMVQGVQSGAATNARIDGVDVAGKTGTAQNGSDDPYTLWFTGFAPADDPKVAVAVVVEDGGGLGQDGYGNLVAAPIAKKVLEAVLNK